MYKSIIIDSIKNYSVDAEVVDSESFEILINQNIIKIAFIKFKEHNVFVLIKGKSINYVELVSELKNILKKNRLNLIICSTCNFDELDSDWNNFCKISRNIKIVMKINSEEASIDFGKNKKIQSRVFSERLLFLVNEYTYSTKTAWEKEMNILYSHGIKIGKS